MKNALKVIASVLIFTLLCVGINKGIGYITNDDTLYFSRVAIKEMYDSEDIDTVYLGASVAFYALDPNYIDPKLGTNSFNLSTMHQNMDGSFYLLKEAYKTHHIKEAYVDVFYEIATLFEAEKRKDLTSMYLITDYTKPSLDKFLYEINGSNDKHYFNTFLISRRNWQLLLDPTHIKDVVSKKLTPEYRSGGLVYKETRPNEYVSKGFVHNNKKLQTEGNLFRTTRHNPINIDKLSPTWVKALEQMIDYCEKHDIKLHLIATPLSNYRIYSIGNYDEFIKFINHKIEGTHADYYDFNLLREEYFPDTTTSFSDDHHMSYEGTLYFEDAFCKLMSGEVSREELFYNSIEEKFATMKKNVFGFVLTHGDDYDITVTPVTTITEGVYSYYIEVQDENKNVMWTYDTTVDAGLMAPDNGVHFTYGDEHCIVIVKCFVDGEQKAQAAFELNK
ncbi:MAG: hypothetical protein IK050_04210 [Lachnospiraceae bacterium]|nr:hypothetical protein [Lachnospiraceae bacterium]